MIYNYNDPWQTGMFPSVLCIGDSWFWYPKSNNVLEALQRHPKMSKDIHYVRIGKNGAQLADYVDLPNRPGQHSADLQYNLKPNVLQYMTTFMISGAGNDALHYGLALKPVCTGLTDPMQCIDPDGLSSLLLTVSKSLGLLIHEVLWAFKQINRSPWIILHAYDYPVPDGRGFAPLPGITVNGPWLSKALNDHAVAPDPILRKAICKILIDQLAATMVKFQDSRNGILFIDSRGTLSTDDAIYQKDWDNELHPTDGGFDQIVDRHWIPTFQNIGMARP